MSILSEIARLSSNVSAAKAAIASKGVVVPSSAKSDDLAALIYQIESGSSDLFIVDLSWNGTTGVASKTYDEIKQVVEGGKHSELGDLELGSSILGGTMYVYGIAQLTGQTSIYGTSAFPASLYEFDDVSKKAWFLVTPSLMLSVDEYGAVGKRDMPVPTVNYDSTTHILSLS